MTQKNPPLRFKQADGTEYPDWQTEKLGDVFTFETATSKSKYIEDVGKYLIADMGAVSEQGNLIANKQTNYNKDMLKTSDLIMPKDDIGTGLIIGKVAMIDQENKYICGDHVFKIIYDNLEYSPYFLKSLFNSTINNRKIKKVCQGSPILGLGKENLKSVSVLMPCLGEQKQIADFLSIIDKRIELLQAKYDNLQKYKTGILQKIFTQQIRFKHPNGKKYPDWQTKKLGDIVYKESSSLNMGNVGENGKYEVYGASGICGKTDSYMSDNTYIGIVKDGSGVGNSYLCGARTSILGTLDKIDTIDNNNIIYAYYLLNQINFKKYIIGSTIPHIYFKEYKNEKCFIASKDEQAKIANFLSALDEKITKTKTQITATKSFKQGLLQQMLT